MKNLDPSRTATLRRVFMADMKRRVKALNSAIIERIEKQDIFGLNPRVPVSSVFSIHSVRRVYEFKTSAEKTRLWKDWLQEQVALGILETKKGEAAWTQPYIQSAYRKGVVRAYIETHKGELVGTEFGLGSQAQFLRDAFAAPETAIKLKTLFTRSFDGLKGFTSEMDIQTSRALTLGLANGSGARKVARELVKQVDTLSKKRALTIARTEIVNAHAEGQLDSYHKMGVRGVNVMAEWSTAGDDRVCSQCGDMQGQTITVEEAHGLIPMHPNCRCAWMPSMDAIK